MEKVWFITGSSRGLGRSLAREILQKGGQVVATARNIKDIQDLKNDYGDMVLLLPLDVTDFTAIKMAVKQAVEHFGRIDVLVNNAGFGIIGAAEAFTDEQVRSQLETNLYAPIELSRAVIPYMRRQGSGHILQISSIGGRVASTGISIYQAAKFGLSGFTEALNKEVATLGITVIAIEPGGIKTDWSGESMTYADSPEDYVDIGQRTSFFKNGSFVPMGDPDKMARVMVDLVEHPAPPVHLVLGSDAVGILQNGTTIREKELKQWLNVSVSTDADESVNFVETDAWKSMNSQV
ncbi:MAG TPA: SDR family NAD(P)-dependent oxidoreductase [Arachidicoccus sp.]|nr:SDR family NAD(P)-dependent oxidoreductase [Arachidicoccus sp.]